MFWHTSNNNDETLSLKNKLIDAESLITAIDRSMAVISFDLDGLILDANSNFLAVVGYSLNDIVGQHHRIFCTVEDVQSNDYTLF